MTPSTIALVLALFVLGLTSCSPATDESATPGLTATPETTAPPTGLPERGGTLRTESNYIPYVSDPSTDSVGTGQGGLLIAEALVWVGEDGIPHPRLAKSWEVSEDAMEWTIHLQEGVTFNNGKPFGADDVIWNLNHWLDPDTGSSMAIRLDFLSPSGIEKIDELTIKLHLDRPHFNILLSLYAYSSMIAPEGGWEDFYSGNPADAVGTGPFLMESFTPDERLVLVRNPNYWQLGADGQPLPYVDKVIVTAGWDDAARLAALLGDEADLLTPGEGILPALQRYPDQIATQTYHVGWITPIVMRTDLPPFDDVRVRTALKLVQDRERIRDLVMPLGPLGNDHFITSSDLAYCPDTDTGGEQDIVRARELLAEAGYPDGLELDLAVPDGDHRTSFAQVYREMAAEAGITVNINILPNAAFWDQWLEWPFSIGGFNGRVPATANINNALRCDSPFNETHYCNPALDALLDEADRTVDVDTRQDIYCQIQTIMQEDSGYLLPFWSVEFGASRNNVHFPAAWPRDTFNWHLTWFSN